MGFTFPLGTSTPQRHRPLLPPNAAPSRTGTPPVRRNASKRFLAMAAPHRQDGNEEEGPEVGRRALFVVGLVGSSLLRLGEAVAVAGDLNADVYRPVSFLRERTRRERLKESSTPRDGGFRSEAPTPKIHGGDEATADVRTKEGAGRDEAPFYSTGGRNSMATFQGGGEIILWLLVLLSCVLNHERVDARGLSPQEEDLELERQLNTINKPAIKTFSMENGDTVDCVDIYKQPAFDNPLLKDHKVQLDQNFTGSSIRRAESELKEPYRLASLELVECPEGTVPIRRIRKEELRNHNMNRPTLQMPSQEANLAPGYYYAIRATGIGRFKGAHVGLSIHELANVKPQQFSSSQLILWGDDPSAMGDAMFVGWNINPDLYGDIKPRFTIYFQSGGRGCFNLLCPGFVYTSKKYYLGSTFGLQYGPGVVNVITLDYVMSESGPPRWQIVIKDHTVPEGYDVLGYWPAQILKNFPDNNAARVVAGGLVYSPPNEKSPPMGYGDWPTDGRQFAAYVRSVCYLKEDFKQDCIFDKDEFINFGAVLNTDPRCYGLGKMLLNDDLEGHFYYGGPGGCPP